MKNGTKTKEIIVEVTEAEYRRELATGLREDEVLKPGSHKFKRGGFLARHGIKPDQATSQVKVRVVPASRRKKKASASDAELPGASTKTQAKAGKKKSPASPAQTKKTKKQLTAREATMLAWQDTYAKRHKRAA